MSSKSRIYLLLLHIDDILENVDREEVMALKARIKGLLGRSNSKKVADCRI